VQALKRQDYDERSANSVAREIRRPKLVLPALLSSSLACVLFASTAWPQSEKPVIVALVPTSGPIGTVVAIQGRGFTSDNTIEFRRDQDSFEIGNVKSDDGISLKFEVNACPSYQSRCPARYIAPASYIVTIRNAAGRSNEAAFSLTARAGCLDCE